jgi:hypothetical protein
MKDLHLFNFSEQVSSIVQQRWRSCQNALLCKPDPPCGEFDLVLPKKYRELRALAVSSWFGPEWLQWEIRLRLENFVFSLDFNNKGLIHSLELRLLVSSKENAMLWLLENYSTSVIFGTILFDDLLRAFNSTRCIIRGKGPVRRIQRKRGYRDKGTWRPPHRWLERDDISFRSQQMLIEKKRLYITLVTQVSLYRLRLSTTKEE